MKALLKLINPGKVRSILDIGTGSGDFIKILIELFTESQIVGIDPDDTSLEKARQHLTNGRIQFYKMNAENLKFGDDYFDLVCISNALHHLPDREIVIREMKRVVKPDGYLVFSELFSDNLNPAQEVQKLYHHTRSRVDRLLGIYHRETWTRSEIIRIVQENGIHLSGYFDFERKVNLVSNDEDLEEWVEKMKQNIERAKGQPEYKLLLPVIHEFRKRASKYGLQPATNVVIVGRK